MDPSEVRTKMKEKTQMNKEYFLESVPKPTVKLSNINYWFRFRELDEDFLRRVEKFLFFGNCDSCIVTAQDENGKKGVFTWGRNNEGQLGVPTGKVLWIPGDKPLRISLFDDVGVIDIAAGNDFVALLTEDENLYMWGHNNYGQIDHLYKNKWVEKPTLVMKNIVEVKCGNFFTAAKFGNGDLRFWGCIDNWFVCEVLKTQKYRVWDKHFEEYVIQFECGPLYLLVLMGDTRDSSKHLYYIGVPPGPHSVTDGNLLRPTEIRREIQFSEHLSFNSIAVTFNRFFVLDDFQVMECYYDDQAKLKTKAMVGHFSAIYGTYMEAVAILEPKDETKPTIVLQYKPSAIHCSGPRKFLCKRLPILELFAIFSHDEQNTPMMGTLLPNFMKCLIKDFNNPYNADFVLNANNKRMYIKLSSIKKVLFPKDSSLPFKKLYKACDKNHNLYIYPNDFYRFLILVLEAYLKSENIAVLQESEFAGYNNLQMFYRKIRQGHCFIRNTEERESVNELQEEKSAEPLWKPTCKQQKRQKHLPPKQKMIPSKVAEERNQPDPNNQPGLSNQDNARYQSRQSNACGSNRNAEPIRQGRSSTARPN